MNWLTLVLKLIFSMSSVTFFRVACSTFSSALVGRLR